MEFSTEKYISNFISSQFPQFYNEDGENFVLFMKAYYEWLEASGNPVYQTRRLYDYRDIDNTLESFLEYFQKKYLYGIPFNVIANKRFLLKRILDVYRSKGTIQCYRLLFKLLYNEDIEIYLPGRDILRISDGTWNEPRYLEVSANEATSSYIGKTIVGVSSGITAIVESFVEESYNTSKINILYLSNISPRNGQFILGEKITELGFQTDTESVTDAPTILGSLDKINVVNGGQGYNLGDVIKIAYRDVSNGDVISYGVDGILKITELSTGFGSLNIDLLNGGFGFTANAETFLYKSTANGQGASFEIGSIINTQTLQYNTDLICDYMSLQIDVATYGFPANASANQLSTLQESFSYSNQVFGTIFSLNNVETGNNYDTAANVFVRSVQLGKPLTGTLSYNTTSNTVTGVSTIFDDVFYYNNDLLQGTISGTVGENTVTGVSTGFTDLFPNDKIKIGANLYYIDAITNNTFMQLKTNLASSISANTFYKIYYDKVIALQSNSSLSSTLEFAVIKDVSNSTQIVLYGPPSINSTASAEYFAAPTILPSQYAIYETPMLRGDETINGENEVILAPPNLGNNIVSEAIAINSGKGYVEGEEIKAYLHSSISNNISILNGGINYSNGELIYFAGGEPGSSANGYVSTDGNGTVISTTLTNAGSGYRTIPNLIVYSANGSGAQLTAVLQEFNTSSSITGKVQKTGLGRGRGYWSTTRGFLNSDKYIQDSYYYQDYSYEIKVSKTLDKYKDIIYNTFHNTGSELFGQFLKLLSESTNNQIVEEFSNSYTSSTTYILSSETDLTSDNDSVTVDKYFI